MPQEIVIDLSQEKLDFFNNPNIFVGLEFEFLETESGFISIFASDFIDVSAELDIELKMDIGGE